MKKDTCKKIEKANQEGFAMSSKEIEKSETLNSLAIQQTNCNDKADIEKNEGHMNEEVKNDHETERTDSDMNDGETGLNSVTAISNNKSSIQQESGYVNSQIENMTTTKEAKSPMEGKTYNGSTLSSIHHEGRDLKDKSLTHSTTTTNETQSPLDLLGISRTTKPRQVTNDSSLITDATSLNQPPRGNLVSVRKSKYQVETGENHAKRMPVTGHTVLCEHSLPHHTNIPKKSHEWMTIIGQDLEIIDEKLKNLRSRRNGLEGQVDFIEETMDYLEHIACGFEKDCSIVQCKNISEERGNLDERVRWLYKRLLNLCSRTEVIEINLRTGTVSDEQHCESDDNSDFKNTEKEPVINVVKKLEDGLSKPAERLFTLQETRYGEEGRIKVLKSRIKYQEKEVINLEKGRDPYRTPICGIKSVNINDQLSEMENASRNLISRLEFLEKN